LQIAGARLAGLLQTTNSTLALLLLNARWEFYLGNLKNDTLLDFKSESILDGSLGHHFFHSGNHHHGKRRDFLLGLQSVDDQFQAFVRARIHFQIAGELLRRRLLLGHLLRVLRGLRFADPDLSSTIGQRQTLFQTGNGPEFAIFLGEQLR
jgi:hypothetical protein